MDSRTAFHSSGVRSRPIHRSVQTPQFELLAPGTRTLVPRTAPWPWPTAGISGRPAASAFFECGRQARPDRRSADACPPEKCRPPYRRFGDARRSRRRCRARPRRSTPASARRARFRPAPPWPSTAAQTPSASSAALPYLPAGTALTSPMASLPSPIRPARSKPFAILVSALESAGATSTSVVAEQLHFGVRLGQLLVGEVFHPVEVGRNEDVGRRAALDLLGERRARRIGDRRLLAASAFAGRVDVVERVLQAGRREHDDLVVGACSRHADGHHRRQAGDCRRHPHPKNSPCQHHETPL